MVLEKNKIESARDSSDEAVQKIDCFAFARKFVLFFYLINLPAYAEVSFMELSLGLAYLSNFALFITNIFIVKTISAIGVIKSLQKGMNVKCACLGTVLSIPLSTISVVENVGMGLMAFINILLNL